MPVLIRRFLRQDAAAVSLEYALIGTLLSLAILMGVGALSGSVQAAFQKQSETVTDSWHGRI